MNVEEVISEIVLNSRLKALDESEISRQLSKRDSSVLSILKKLEFEGKIIGIRQGEHENIRYYHNENIEKFQNRVISELEKHHRCVPFSRGLTRSELRSLISNKKKQKALESEVFDLVIDGLSLDSKVQFGENFIQLSGFEVQKDEKKYIEILNLYKAFCDDIEKEKIQTISIKEFNENYSTDTKKCLSVFKKTENDGRILRISLDRYAAEQFIVKIQLVLCKAKKSGEQIKISDITFLLQSSRKHIIPAMEYLDRTGFSKREGDFRLINEENCEQLKRDKNANS